jgi:hypothetical protein
MDLLGSCDHKSLQGATGIGFLHFTKDWIGLNEYRCPCERIYHLNSIAGVPQIADELHRQYESGILLDSDVVRQVPT